MSKQDETLHRRLEGLEKLGKSLVARYTQSSSARVVLASVVPMLRELYPQTTFFVSATNDCN